MSIPAEKRCARCGKVKPASSFWPHYDLRGWEPLVHLAAYCKPCNVADIRQRYHSGPSGRPTTTFGSNRRCGTCRRMLPLSDFRICRRDRTGKTYRHCYCRPCDAARSRGYYRKKYGIPALCPRGSHPWPVERACRGFDSLGCGHLGPHVHRYCPIHSTETIDTTRRAA